MRITHVQDDEISGMFSAQHNDYGELGYLVWDFPKDNVIEICDLIIHKQADALKGVELLLIKSFLDHAIKLGADKVVGKHAWHCRLQC